MEYRAEPRFPVRSPIRVIVPGDPARILSCDLIDVSATGMRFITAERVTPDEIVAVEVDSRLVLVEIRYCQPRGDKFVAGVKRLQEIPKGAELKDSAACATEMIWDLRRHISAGGEGDLQALAMKALERIVERSEIQPAGQEPNPESNQLELLPALFPRDPLPSQPPPQATNGTADFGKATNGNADGYPETASVAISISSEPRPSGSGSQILPAPNASSSEPRPSGSGGQILPTPNASQLGEMPPHQPVKDAEAQIEVPAVLAAGVTDVARADLASSPSHKGGDSAESGSAEIEFQEPGEAPIPDEAPLPDDAPIHETILQEQAGTVPHVLQAEVIEPDVEAHPSGCAQTDALEGDVLEGDDTDPPLADFLGGSVSAGIESQAPVAERPVTEPVAPVAVAPVVKIPVMVRAPIDSGAAHAPIHETILQEQAGTVPHVLQAEGIQPDVEAHPDGCAQTDALPGDVLEGDDTDPPVADFLGGSVSAGIESPAPVAERPVTEPVAPVAVAPFVKIPVMVRPIDSGAAEADPHFTALRAEIAARDSADAAADASARASRSWRVPLGIAAALLLACTITFFLVQRRTQASSLAPAIVVGPATVAPAPVPAPAAIPPASIPSPAAVPPASVPSPAAVPAASVPSPYAAPPTNKVGVHHARLKIVDASWVTLVVDGGKPFQSMLYKGDVHEFDFSQKAFLRLGNASGVEITLDDTPIGPLKDTVVLLQLTPHGVEFPKFSPPPSIK